MTTRNKMIIASFALLSLAILAIGARHDRTAIRLNQSALDLLEQHIPFRVETLSELAPEDDALELEIIVQQDEHGRDLEYAWRAMDGDTLLVECDDFYDLYYRCDGPSLFNVRVITRDHTGRQISVRRGFISIN
jgi:hypothetical protein